MFGILDLMGMVEVGGLDHEYRADKRTEAPVRADVHTNGFLRKLHAYGSQQGERELTKLYRFLENRGVNIYEIPEEEMIYKAEGCPGFLGLREGNDAFITTSYFGAPRTPVQKGAAVLHEAGAGFDHARSQKGAWKEGYRLGRMFKSKEADKDEPFIDEVLEIAKEASMN